MNAPLLFFAKRPVVGFFIHQQNRTYLERASAQTPARTCTASVLPSLGPCQDQILGMQYNGPAAVKSSRDQIASGDNQVPVAKPNDGLHFVFSPDRRQYWAHGQMFHISRRGKGLRDRTCVQPRVPDVDCMDSTIKPKTQMNQQFVDQGHGVETKKW